MVLTIADGNVVHLENLDCLVQFGQRWRGAAVAALRTLRLNPPPGFEPISAALVKS
jgi:hypothetical protein